MTGSPDREPGIPVRSGIGRIGTTVWKSRENLTEFSSRRITTRSLFRHFDDDLVQALRRQELPQAVCNVVAYPCPVMAGGLLESYAQKSRTGLEELVASYPGTLLYHGGQGHRQQRDRFPRGRP